jgi:glucose/arabinose dehydrogenase
MIPRQEFKDVPDLLELVESTTPPEWRLGAHWAPNGFTFLSKPYFSDDHRGDAFIACHGSWNSTSKVGYRVERVLFDKVSGKPYGSLMVVGTLAPDGRILGRPVDCVEAPDGSVLLSDDQTGQVYRIENMSSSGSKSSPAVVFGQNQADKKDPKKRGAHESKGR